MVTKRKWFIRITSLVLLGVLLCLIAPGCQKEDPYIPTDPEVSPYSSFTPHVDIPEQRMVRRDYRLNPGDKLEINGELIDLAA